MKSYFEMFDNDDTIKNWIGTSAKRIFPAIKEKSIEGDYEVFTFPSYKDALKIMQGNNFNASLVPHRDQFVHYTNDFLNQIGIYKEYIVQELEPYYANEDLLDIQSEIDEEKVQIRDNLPKINGIDLLFNINDTRLVELSKAKLYFIKKYLGKIFGTWETKVLERKEVQAPIRVFTIHSPKVNGSRCEYVETKTNMEMHAYGISVFGIGSKSHKLIGIKNQNGYTAKDGRCYEILKHATFVVEKRVEVYGGKRQCKPYIEAYLKDPDKGYDKKPLSPDECESLRTHTEFYDGFNLSKAQDEDTCSLEISRNETRKFMIDLGFLFNTKIGIDVESLSNTTKKLSYTLPGGYHYKTFVPQDSFGYVWQIL